MTTEAENAPSPATGTLRVSVASPSALFRDTARVSIHDSRMMPVEMHSHQREFQLAPGLYQVSAVLHDGREHRHLLHVEERRTSVVELGASVVSDAVEPAIGVGEDVNIRLSGKQLERLLPVLRGSRQPWPIKSRIDLPVGSSSVGGDAVAKRPLDWFEGFRPSKDAPLALAGMQGVEAEWLASGDWRFKAVGETRAVATATVSTRNDHYTISLPVSHSPYNNDSSVCHLGVDSTAPVGAPDAWMAPERTVARALQNMLASGRLSSAVEMADDAIAALREKYRDPAGAALGALILHRFGRLDGRLLDWLTNLARDFAWLPDGRILLAAHLVQRDGYSAQAHDMVLSASRQRILFTESFALLLELLRRWRGPQAEQETHHIALRALTDHSPFVDWSKICLSIRNQRDEHA